MVENERKPPGSCEEHPVPAPSNLAGWKAVDRSLSGRIREQMRRTPTLRSVRAVSRYFGKDDLESFLIRHAGQGVEAAYASWAVLGYRPTCKSKTHAEKTLEKGLPEQHLRAGNKITVTAHGKVQLLSPAQVRRGVKRRPRGVC